ncbi:MAG: CinA family nicotinamide mononucleotide deamidase-related protein [Deltaproteobacteria bacterium]|nr:CinA family nicotinamide mononucleotide deamidase-related protein [Deltaproteobacteria bacterium]
MRAEILTIGDELCRGEIVDTNSSYLASQLWDLGITTRWMTSCNDEDADLATALRLAASRADLVICSGGLGPTEDDLTVDVLARLLGVAPEIDQPARQRMEAWFAGRVEVTPIQLRQVRVPQGARVHENPVGLAPCFETLLDGVPVICMPGVPRELHAIVDRGLRARLVELRDLQPDREVIARQIYRVFGRGESQISQACRGLVDDVPGTSIHYQVKFPETLVKLVCRDRDQAAADARLAGLDREIRQRLAPQLYSAGDESMVERVMRRLLEAKQTAATAESCTGGMVGEMLTRMPGSSKAFLGGAITYINDEKERQLGVQHATLVAHGAVSEETAREMCVGALAAFRCDHAVAITGIAGPDGGSKEKPVGTVWLGLASRGIDGVVTRKLNWPSTRDQVRLLSAWWALAMIDAAIPSSDPIEQARAKWVLEPRTIIAEGSPLVGGIAEGSPLVGGVAEGSPLVGRQK